MEFPWPGRLTPEVVASFYAAGDWVSTTANERLDALALERPGAFALVDRRRRLTYAGYREEAENLAALFVRLGLGRDDVVAIQLPNCVEFAVAINAAMRAGIPFCQFHHGFRSKEVEFVLRFSRARAAIVPHGSGGFDYVAMLASLRGSLPHLEHVIVVGESVPDGCIDFRAEASRRAGAGELELLRLRRPKADDLCRMAFTSGTTGDPKAVVHTHNTSNATSRSSARDQAMSGESAMLLFLPVGLNWGLGCTKQTLHAGGKIVYMEKFDPSEVLQLVERERITHFVTAPASLIALIEAVAAGGRADLSSLEAIVSGGASCPVEVLREARRTLGVPVVEMYGMLESGVQARTFPSDDPAAVAGTVGRPVREARVRVCDERDRALPAGEIGQIECFGPSVMLGYYENSEADARAFSADGYLRTGDLGVFDERGLLRIAGRTKEMIIRGGANIYPREIEEVLFAHPAIADCAVVGVPHPRLGETAVACVVLRPGVSLAFEELIAFLEPRVARYKLPERLVIVDDLPRTPTGKVQKKALGALVGAS
ncbi:MAG: AMP-binding protein [Candidatus Eremiobacteraeota bacterium]|nr:AMP-binding protein [Candidatus Eremiobacteraeota bacterium]